MTAKLHSLNAHADLENFFSNMRIVVGWTTGIIFPNFYFKRIMGLFDYAMCNTWELCKLPSLSGRSRSGEFHYFVSQIFQC